MPVAVSLRLDDRATRRVVRIWETLLVRGIDPALLLPGCEAQVTLAAYPDDVLTDRIDDTLDRLSRRWAALRVHITGIGIFGGIAPALWLAVAPTAALLAHHGQLHTALADQPCDAHWRPGRWSPAIMVSEHAVSVAAAVRLLLPMLTKPVDGTLVALELVQRPSGTVISSRDLSAG